MDRVLGPGHPHTLKNRNNLVRAYRTIGRDKEAKELDHKAR